MVKAMSTALKLPEPEITRHHDETEDLSQFPLAPTWTRLCAYAFDAFAMTAGTALISGLGNRFVAEGSREMTVRFAGIVFALAYVYWPVAQYGQTIGKKAFGLRVVNMDHEPLLGWRKALLRESVGKILSVFLLGIGLWMVLFRKDRRALHDLISGTRVVTYRPPVS
jgi:uncharacterized RDD family membrane protein YckC